MTPFRLGSLLQWGEIQTCTSSLQSFKVWEFGRILVVLAASTVFFSNMPLDLPAVLYAHGGLKDYKQQIDNQSGSHLSIKA